MARLLLSAILLLVQVASGQDWQNCKPDGSYSFFRRGPDGATHLKSPAFREWRDRLGNPH